MFQEFKIKRQLKKLRKQPVDKKFLSRLKSRLEIYVDANPAREEFVPKNYFYFSLKNLKAAPVTLIFLIAAVMAGGGAAFAAQKSLPGDTLFPVKILTEEVKSVLTFGSDAQAELQLKFAHERLKEIQEILNKRGVEPKGLEIAISRLEKNSSRAAEVVKLEKEKERGQDAEDLINKAGESLNAVERELRGTLRHKGDDLKTQETHLKAEIDFVRQSDDKERLGRLNTRTREIRGKIDYIESKLESLDNKSRVREKKD